MTPWSWSATRHRVVTGLVAVAAIAACGVWEGAHTSRGGETGR